MLDAQHFNCSAVTDKSQSDPPSPDPEPPFSFPAAQFGQVAVAGFGKTLQSSHYAIVNLGRQSGKVGFSSAK